MQTIQHGRKRQHSRRAVRIATLAGSAALLIQMLTVAGRSVAAGSDDARAVEQGRRSDLAAARSPADAGLRLRIEEMHERRRGRRMRREERLRKLTPEERRRFLDRQPQSPPQRDYGAALERINQMRRRFDGPAITGEP
jgi:hypothetical protein